MNQLPIGTGQANILCKGENKDPYYYNDIGIVYIPYSGSGGHGCTTHHQKYLLLEQNVGII